MADLVILRVHERFVNRSGDTAVELWGFPFHGPCTRKEATDYIAQSAQRNRHYSEYTLLAWEIWRLDESR